MQAIYKTWVLLGVLFVVSCSSSGTSIESVTRAKAIPNAPYSNLLVIAVTQNRGNGRRFENELALALESNSTTATPSHLENNAEMLTETDVKAIVQKIGADAIVVTSVKRADIGTAVEESRVEVQKTRRNDNLIDFFRYDYKEVKTAEIRTLKYTVDLITDVFDGETGEKVYTIESSTMDAETSFDVILQESAAIARQMRRGGIVD